MDTLNLDSFIKILDEMANEVFANEALLNKLDSKIGDGDHGITMRKGFTGVRNTIQTKSFTGISELLTETGKAMSRSMGGASGPIFSSILVAAGENCSDKQELCLDDIVEMFDAVLSRIKKLGGAKEGDCTVVDALAPALESLKESSKNSVSLQEALKKAADSAMQGAQETKNMIAKKGRARFSQEESLGFQDAGATSFALMMKAMYDAII